MSLAQAAGESAIVLRELREHVAGLHILCIVVRELLQPGDVTNRPERGFTQLAHALGNRIGHREQLVGMLIEQHVIVAEVRAAHVPMKVLGLEIQRKHIGCDCIQGRCNFPDGLRFEVRAECQRRLLPRQCVSRT